MSFIGKNPKWNTSSYAPQSADPSNPVEGMVFRSDGTSRAEGLWEYINGNWSFVGAGISDKSVYAQFDAEDKSITDFTNITITTTNPLNQENSYSVNSYPATLPVVTLQDRNKSKDNSVSVHYKMTSGTAKLVVKDQSSTTLAEQEISSTSIEKAILVPFISDSTTTLQLSIEDVSSATGLVIDDIVFSDDPFTYKNLINSQSAYYNTLAGYGSTNNKIPYFTNEVSTDGSGIVTVENDSTNGFSITALIDCTVNFSWSVNANAATAFGVSLNSSQLTTGISSITTSDRIAYDDTSSSGVNATISASINLKAGDVLRPHTESSPPAGTANRNHLSFTAISEAEHVITPAKATLSDWISFTPTWSAGFGSPTNNEGRYRQVGDSIECQITATVGTVAPSVGYIELPFGLTIDTNKVSKQNTTAQDGPLVGGYEQNSASQSQQGNIVLATNTDNQKVYFGPVQNISTDHLGIASAVSATVTSTGREIAVNFKVPIAEWSSDANFLAAIPVDRVCYVKDLKASSSPGGTFTSGSWQTRDLNTLEGDTTFISLSSNQITLQAGTYDIDSSCRVSGITNAHQARFRNITDSTTEIVGSSAHSGGGDDQSESFCNGVITITSTKTFELQHRCATTVTTVGFGRSNGFGEGELYSQIKITKRK